MSRFKPTGHSSEKQTPQSNIDGDGSLATKLRAPVRSPSTRPVSFERFRSTQAPAVAHQSTALSLPEEEPSSTLETLSLTFTLCYLFLRVCFLHDLLASLVHSNLYLIVIFGALAYPGLLRGATWQPSFNSKIFWCWAIFSALLVIGIPFSFWPGGSKDVAYPFVRNDFICFPLVAGLYTTKRRLRRLLLTLSSASIVFILLAFFKHSQQDGRMVLEWSGSVDNSNDLAAHSLFIMPFLLFAAFASNVNFVLRLVFLSGLPLALYMILATGSRGAFIAIAAGVVYTLLTGNLKLRVGFLLGMGVLAAGLLTFVPQSALSRLTTFEDNTGRDNEAVASYEARQQLLMKSLAITAQHPFLGTGPGQFAAYEGSTAADQGHGHANWQETHNTYTQVSSEDGVPALLCFLSALIGTFVLLRKTLRATKDIPELRDLRLACQVLTIGLVTFSVCIFFLSQAYRYYLPLLGGITIALYNLVKKHRASMASDSSEALTEAIPRALATG